MLLSSRAWSCAGWASSCRSVRILSKVLTDSDCNHCGKYQVSSGSLSRPSLSRLSANCWSSLLLCPWECTCLINSCCLNLERWYCRCAGLISIVLPRTKPNLQTKQELCGRQAWKLSVMLDSGYCSSSASLVQIHCPTFSRRMLMLVQTYLLFDF